MQSILHLYFSSEISKELKEIYNFFDSHFIISPGITGEPLASLYFNKYEDFDWEPYKGMKVFTQTIRNKKGSATDFNLEVEKVLVTDDIDLFHNKLTNTVLILNKSLKIASFYISEKSKYYIIDFIRDLIIKGGTTKAIEDQAKKDGMMTMIEDGIYKSVQGVTTIEEVLRVAQD